jgi:hypothetical protein
LGKGRQQDKCAVRARRLKTIVKKAKQSAWLRSRIQAALQIVLRARKDSR